MPYDAQLKGGRKKMENKTNMLLKVTGILMIIGGIAGIIVSIIAMLGVGALALLIGGAVGLLMFAVILSLVGSIIELIAGIVGSKNAANPAKAGTCVIFGIVTLALSVLGIIINLAGGGSFSVANLGLGVVIPVLYLIGALQNKNKAA